MKTFSFTALWLMMVGMTQAQAPTATFHPESRVFRLDGGNVSYVFGVNSRGELQQLYWGGRLGANDAFPPAQPMPEWASFDGS